MRTSAAADDGFEGLAEVVGEGVGGGDGLPSGLDLDGAVAAGGLDEFPDRPAGLCFDPAADGEGGEHDRQVGLDGVALAVVDRPGLQVGLRHAEALLDLEEPVVGADHEVRGDRRAVRAGREVGDVALDPGQVPGLRLQLAVDALGRAVEGDEPVPLDRGQPGDGFGGLGDLLVDPAQRPPGPVGLVLVVDDLVTALARTARRARAG